MEDESLSDLMSANTVRKLVYGEWGRYYFFILLKLLLGCQKFFRFGQVFGHRP